MGTDISGWAPVDMSSRNKEAVEVGHTSGINLNVISGKAGLVNHWNELVLASSQSQTLLAWLHCHAWGSLGSSPLKPFLQSV